MSSSIGHAASPSRDAGKFVPTVARRKRARGRSVLEFTYFLPVLVLYGVALLLPLVTTVENALSLDLAGWWRLLKGPLFTRAIGNTALLSIGISIISVVLAYTVAAAIWRSGRITRAVLTFLVVMPFWTSVLVKIVAWQALLRDSGIINTVLIQTGLIGGPLTLLHAKTAVVLGMIQYVLPFAVFPILSVMLRLDPKLEQAAESLGSTPFRVFRHVILPLTAPGVLAALILVFVISIGFYVIPATLGGAGDKMIANVVALYALQLVDFNQASAVGLVLLVVVAVLTALYHRVSGTTEESR